MMRALVLCISFALVRSNQLGSEENESGKKQAWHHGHHHHHHHHHHEWQDWVRDENAPLPPAAREAQEHSGKKIALSDARGPMTYELELNHVVMDQDGTAHEASTQHHSMAKASLQRGDGGDDTPNPACSWHCSNPVCEEACQPVCAKPICKTFCQPLKMASCTTVCGAPVCHVICPTGSAGKRSADCKTTCGPPQCETKCQRQCESVCGKPSCQLECQKPKTCPKPTCQMVCSGPAVNAVPDQAEVPEGNGIEVASGEAQLGSICPPGCMRAPAPGAPTAGANATAAANPVAMAVSFIQSGVKYTKIGNKFWPCPANCVSTPALVQLMNPGAAANATIAL